MIRAILALSRLWHDSQPYERVSDAWLREHKYSDRHIGYDQMAWRWPLNTVGLNDGKRNAKRLRVVA